MTFRQTSDIVLNIARNIHNSSIKSPEIFTARSLRTLLIQLKTKWIAVPSAEEPSMQEARLQHLMQ